MCMIRCRWYGCRECWDEEFGDGNVTNSSVDIVPMEGIEPSEEIRELPVVKAAHEKR